MPGDLRFIQGGLGFTALHVTFGLTFVGGPVGFMAGGALSGFLAKKVNDECSSSKENFQRQMLQIEQEIIKVREFKEQIELTTCVSN